MSEQMYYAYILANTFHRLYTGMTNDLQGRVYDHKHPADRKAFTARYGIDRLVYFERFPYVEMPLRGKTDQELESG